MGRAPRIDLGGQVYHILNRANGRLSLFENELDYLAFLRIVRQAQDRTDMRLLAWCVMPNHWHLVLWPRRDGDLARFTGWLTLTHTQRWHVHRHSVGEGHIYQGRYKSFIVGSDHYLATACRYVERNALRAKLVTQAEDWPWGSLHEWVNRHKTVADADELPVLSDWPAGGGDRPRNWRAQVNAAMSLEEEESLGLCMSRGRPFGEAGWVK